MALKSHYKHFYKLIIMISFLQYKFKTKHIDMLEFFNKYFDCNYLILVFTFCKSIGGTICIGIYY